MTNKRGETGEPCGMPTDTGDKTFRDPWKRRRHDLPVRKERVQDTRYGLTPFALSMPQSVEGLTLSKPPLISRNRVEIFLLSICRVLTSCERVVQASATDKPAREPH